VAFQDSHRHNVDGIEPRWMARCRLNGGLL